MLRSSRIALCTLVLSTCIIEAAGLSKRPYATITVAEVNRSWKAFLDYLVFVEKNYKRASYIPSFMNGVAQKIGHKMGINPFDSSPADSSFLTPFFKLSKPERMVWLNKLPEPEQLAIIEEIIDYAHRTKHGKLCPALPNAIHEHNVKFFGIKPISREKLAQRGEQLVQNPNTRDKYYQSVARIFLAMYWCDKKLS